MNKYLTFKELNDDSYLMMSIRNDHYYHINKTAYLILSLLENGSTVGKVCDYMAENYTISREDALRMVDSCTKMLASPYVEKNFDRNLLSSPFRIGWNITNRCNLNCRHCYTRANETELKELDINGCSKVVDALIEAQILDLVLTGGEPMVREDFSLLYERLQESGISLTVFTNATLVKRHISSIAKGWARFLVSLDGLEETHNGIRGSGVFKRTEEGILLLKENGQQVILNVTLTPALLKELPEFLSYVYGVLDVNIQLGMMLPIGRAEENEDMLVDVDMYSEAMKIIINYSKERGENVAGLSFGQDSKVNTLYMNNAGSLFVGKDEWQCNAGYSKVTIRPNGDVYPCAFVRKYKMGNLVKEDAERIWTNKNRDLFINYISDNKSRLCNPVQKQIILRREARDARKTFESK